MGNTGGGLDAWIQHNADDNFIFYDERRAALDPETGKTIWDFKLARPSLQNGVMATAGGVVFAASRDGDLIALDAQTGTSLWRYQTRGNMRASPMSFAVEDRQYVAIASGDTIYCFALPK